jgi:hypothetical protein
MPHIPYFNDFEYWRQQAAETRALAERMDDKVAKATILKMAGDCDKLAVWAAVRIKDVRVT